MQSSIAEYDELFKVQYSEPSSDQKGYQSFFTDLIEPVNKLVLGYLNDASEHFNTHIQASLLVLSTSYQQRYMPSFIKDIFQKVLNFHLQAVKGSIFDQIMAIDFEGMC